MELSCKSCLTNYFLSLLHATVLQKLPLNLFLKLLRGTVVQKLPSKLFLKLLFGTVAQKLPCEASPQGKTPNGIPGRCNVLLSHGGGLGRSLSYVGRSQISLFMMLPGSVVHKLPFAAASEAFAWNRRAKLAFPNYPAGFAWKCLA